MQYFTHLTQYSVVVCNECQYAILPQFINTHLRKQPHYLTSQARTKEIDQVEQIQLLIRSQEELEDDLFRANPIIQQTIPVLAIHKWFQCGFPVQEYTTCPHFMPPANNPKALPGTTPMDQPPEIRTPYPIHHR